MPKVVNHQRRREDLAQLTVEVISTVGIEKTTIREIARRGGLSMGMLTHYFTSKDELVSFAFRWISEQLFAQVDHLAASHPPGLPRLEAAVDAMSRVGKPAGLGLWLSLWDRAARNPGFANEHRVFYARWRRYVRGCLADAASLLQIEGGAQLDEATDLILAAVDGLWIDSAFEPGRFSAPRRRSLLRLQIAVLTQRLATQRTRGKRTAKKSH
jgi:AcrR family transcriptional regulator